MFLMLLRVRQRRRGPSESKSCFSHMKSLTLSFAGQLGTAELRRDGVEPFLDIPDPESQSRTTDPSIHKSRRNLATTASASHSSLLPMPTTGEDQYNYKQRPTRLTVGADGRSVYSYPSEPAIAIPAPRPAMQTSQRRAEDGGIRVAGGPGNENNDDIEARTLAMSELPPLYERRS